jgi:hypothetical protein
MRLVKVCGAGLLLIGSTSAFAAPFVYEGFGTSPAPAPAGQYTADASLSGVGHGTGWSGTWTTTNAVSVTGSLAASGMSDNPGRATTTGVNTARELVRSFSSAGFTALGNEVWFSFAFRRDSGSNGATIRIADSSTRYFGVSMQNTPSAPSELRADLRFSGSTVETSADFVPVSNGSTYFVVGRFQFNASADDRLDVWVNPSSVASVAALGTPSMFVTTTNNYSVFDEIRISNGGNATYSYDEIRLGAAFGDVVIPEPTSLSLLALAAGGMLRRRRA